MSYTPGDPSQIEVICPTPEEVAAAVQKELDDIGLTREQLEAQAIAGKFDSEAARETWFCLD
ncbi:MAG: hypothetical protein OXN44_13400 [Acidimicrobiaceae bacterium]|nr:hypothetical protein [Acidimicrobiaceae bacterium]